MRKYEAKWVAVVALNIALSTSLSACSSIKSIFSKSHSEEKTDVLPLSGDVAPANTDLTPQASIETPFANTNTPLDSPPAAGNAHDLPLVAGAAEDYTVNEGDTLMKIAFDVYGDVFRWKEVYEANKDHVRDPNHIAKGTILKVTRSAGVSVEKNGEKYLIKQGDTLAHISKSLYGNTSQWKKLWENNKHLIHDPNRIFAGFFIYYLPEGSSVAAQPASEAPSSESTPQDLTSVTPAPLTGDDANSHVSTLPSLDSAPQVPQAGGDLSNNDALHGNGNVASVAAPDDNALPPLEPVPGAPSQ
jgi:LysM repeat protein